MPGFHKCSNGNCGKKFSWPRPYSTEKVARSARDRHCRESHGRATKSALAARQNVNRTYNRAARLQVAPDVKLPSGLVYVGVLSVPRREAEGNMFTNTRLRLVQMGFPLEDIGVLHGVDARAGGACVGGNKVVMWGFQYKFIPTALRLFDENPTLELAFFAEDDARPLSGVDAYEIVKAGRAAAPSACRLGWYQCGNHTDYGAHFTSFTRSSCEAFKEVLDGMTSKREPCKHLMSLDIWWGKVREKRMPSGHIIMKNHKKRLMMQMSHPFHGRY